jgi:CubicO group peptidase (beta-lactamase class C family)
MFDREEGIKQLCAAAPETPVGSRQAYHAITAGFILGELVERITGQTLNQVLDTTIRQPLGMHYFHYGIHGDDQRKVPRHYLTGLNNSLLNSYVQHAVGANLKEVVEVSNDPRFMETVVPAGNLYATAEETTRFYQLLLDGGRWQGQQLLQADTLRRATRPVSAPFVLDGSLLLPIRFSAGFMLGARLASLYGPGTQAAFGHLGFISITTWADPARQLSVALLTTGKGVLGPQLPAMFRLFGEINRLR